MDGRIVIGMSFVSVYAVSKLLMNQGFYGRCKSGICLVIHGVVRLLLASVGADGTRAVIPWIISRGACLKYRWPQGGKIT